MFSGHGNQETQIFELEALKEFYLCFLKNVNPTLDTHAVNTLTEKWFYELGLFDPKSW